MYFKVKFELKGLKSILRPSVIVIEVPESAGNPCEIEENIRDQVRLRFKDYDSVPNIIDIDEVNWRSQKNINSDNGIN